MLEICNTSPSYTYQQCQLARPTTVERITDDIGKEFLTSKECVRFAIPGTCDQNRLRNDTSRICCNADDIFCLGVVRERHWSFMTIFSGTFSFRLFFNGCCLPAKTEPAWSGRQSKYRSHASAKTSAKMG
ncbi:hypothetical protein Tcan_15339 [Toxocara canis]|uniref:Uncharacterized protein n=1 Tax=Toxocara canis TaxID=6265 RepID=A0A0B2VHP7_TOXCA|nr:hypothetical protein Tcan_15339 [Toxocara canis]